MIALAPISRGDVSAIRKSLQGDPEVTHSAIPRPAGPLDVGGWINSALADWRSGAGIVFAMRIGSGDIAGFSRLSGIDYGYGIGQIGYWVARSYRCRGYATASTRVLLSLAFEHLGLARIITAVDESNIASRTVLSRAGFTLQKSRRSPLMSGELDVVSAQNFLSRKEDPPVMLIIRNEQMLAFRNAGLRRLAIRFAQEFLARKPEYSVIIAPSALEGAAIDAVRRAWDYGFREDRHLRAMAQLAIVAGPGFDKHPPFESILTRPELTPHERLNYLFTLAGNSDWQEATKQYGTSL